MPVPTGRNDAPNVINASGFETGMRYFAALTIRSSSTGLRMERLRINSPVPRALEFNHGADIQSS